MSNEQDHPTATAAMETLLNVTSIDVYIKQKTIANSHGFKRENTT